jgi:hypothetical protein
MAGRLTTDAPSRLILRELHGDGGHGMRRQLEVRMYESLRILPRLRLPLDSSLPL